MKVLLIDDHPLFREGLALLLKALVEPLEAVHAGSCEEAFGLLVDHADAELVLIDLGLPGMSGLEGLKQLRETHPGLPVVVLSSSDDKDTVLGTLDAGAMGFIPKSSTSAVMLGALRLILSKGIYLPPSVFLAARSPAPPLPASASPIEAAPPARRPVDLGLTPRQAEVLYQILQGKPAKLIGRQLDLSLSTVKAHTSAVLRALNVTTRTQAVVAAGRLGLRFDQDGVAEPSTARMASSSR